MTAIPFLDRAIQSRAKRLKEKSERLMEFLLKGVTAGLSNAEESEFERLASETNAQPESLGAKGMIIQRYHADAKTIGDMAGAEKALAAARQVATQIAAERAAALRKFDVQEYEAARAVEAAAAKVAEIREAKDSLEKIESEHWQLLGIPKPVKVRPIAHLVYKRDDLVAEHRDAILALRREGKDETAATKRMQTEMDAHARATAAATGQVFQLAKVDLDPAQTRIGIDESDFDFKLLPGQSPAEFDGLLAQFRVAREASAKRGR